MKKYQNKVTISNEYFKSSNDIKELAVRQVLNSLIRDIPMEELEKIFIISIRDADSIQKQMDALSPYHENYLQLHDRLSWEKRMLYQTNTTEVKIEITL